MPRLTAVSFAYPGVGSELRGRLCLRPAAHRRALARLRDEDADALVVVTCLRVEILCPGEREGATRLLRLLYGAAAPPVEMGVVREGLEAFVHLCRVTAGLESPQVGEPEVFTQMRQAIADYRDQGGGELGPILSSAVGVARRARRRLGSSGGRTLAGVAAERASTAGRIAILGSGVMGRAVAGGLTGGTPTIFSRRPTQIGGVVTHPWAEGLEALAGFDAVVSTVPGDTPLYPSPDVERMLSARSEPVLIVDLGMPPGLAGIRDHPHVVYVDVDEVAANTRADPPHLAGERLAEDAATAWSRLGASKGTVIAAMVEQADRAVDEEVARFLGRLGEDADPVLRQLAHTVARRVLHPAISYLGTASESEEAQILARVFGVPRR
ncbi:MAG: hypothetical protein L0Z49_09250 [Actinobacteria bacterium]|nr:hypothetical protein [Actinomycetota bacterium]MCI0678444.1 hypothetical protein [Actinomycetota bacterium]